MEREKFRVMSSPACRRQGVRSDKERVLSFGALSFVYALCPLLYPISSLGEQRHYVETHGFWKSQHNIHVLNGFAGSSFDQIINDRDDHGPIL
jgi:hypothetical protein